MINRGARLCAWGAGSRAQSKPREAAAAGPKKCVYPDEQGRERSSAGQAGEQGRTGANRLQVQVTQVFSKSTGLRTGKSYRELAGYTAKVSCLQAAGYPLLEKIVLKHRVLLVEVGADLRVPVPPACAGAGQQLSRPAQNPGTAAVTATRMHARGQCQARMPHAPAPGRPPHGGRALEDASIVVRRCLPYSV